MRNNPILVIGSINMDLIVKTSRCPDKGETVIGKNFNQLPGGKGANQACAISKLNGEVDFVGAYGNDYFGREVSGNLSQMGIDISNLYRIEGRTGTATIIVEEDGDNRIIVSEGANRCLTAEMIEKIEDKIKNAEVILLQLETPWKTVFKAINLANKHGTTVILDPAPAIKLPPEVYSKIDFLLPNESELDTIMKDYRLNSIEETAVEILDLGVGNLIVTKGNKGAHLFNQKKQKLYPSYQFTAVDTTGAGDAFAGALAYGIHKKWDQDKIIDFASLVAGISVTRVGAQSAMPSLSEVDDYIKRLNLPLEI